MQIVGHDRDGWSLPPVPSTKRRCWPRLFGVTEVRSQDATPRRPTQPPTQQPALPTPMSAAEAFAAAEPDEADAIGLPTDLRGVYTRFEHLFHELGKFGVVGIIAYAVDISIFNA